MIIVAIVALALQGKLRLLVSPVTLWLGAISYSLYLLHRNLGYGAMTWMHAHHVPPGIAIPTVAATILMLATAVTYGVERPAMEYLRKWYSRRF